MPHLAARRRRSAPDDHPGRPSGPRQRPASGRHLLHLRHRCGGEPRLFRTDRRPVRRPQRRALASDQRRRASIGQRAVAYSSLDLVSSLADEEAFERFARPQATPFWSLPNQIQRIEDAGFASTAYRLRLQQLLATPLVFAAMSILAAAFSLRLMRLGDLARMSVAAVVLASPSSS